MMRQPSFRYPVQFSLAVSSCQTTSPYSSIQAFNQTHNIVWNDGSDRYDDPIRWTHFLFDGVRAIENAGIFKTIRTGMWMILE